MGVPRALRGEESELRVVRRERGSRLDSGPPETLTPTLRIGGKPSALIFGVAILAIVGALLLARVNRRYQPRAVRTPSLAAAEAVDTLHTAVRLFVKDCGRPPTAREGLIVLVLRPDIPGWDGPYINRLAPDPWGSAYVYQPDATGAVIFSRGPDRLPGTPDDILSVD